MHFITFPLTSRCFLNLNSNFLIRLIDNLRHSADCADYRIIIIYRKCSLKYKPKSWILDLARAIFSQLRLERFIQVGRCLMHTNFIPFLYKQFHLWPPPQEIMVNTFIYLSLENVNFTIFVLLRNLRETKKR